MSQQIAGVQYALGFNASPFVQHSRQASSSANRLRGALLGGAEGASALNIQLFSAGFIGAAALQNAARLAAQFEEQILRASQATLDGAKHVKRMAGTAFGLSSQFKTSALGAAALQKQIAQMGIDTVVPADTNVRKLEKRLARAATALSGTAEIAENEAGKSIFRLALTTGRTNEEIAALLDNSMGLASAFTVLGDSVSAGIPELLKMTQEFQQIGTVTNLTTAQVMAMSAAFAQIDPTKAGRITSGIVRLFSTEFVQNVGAVSRFMGMTREEVNTMRQEQPFEFFQRFTGALVEAGKAGEDLPRVIRDMGFGNIRDQRNLAIYIRMQEQVPELLRRAEEEMKTQAEITGRYNELLNTLSFGWKGFINAAGRAGITIGGVLAPALKGVLAALEGIANIVSDNKFVAGMLALGAIGVGAATIGRAGVFAAGAMSRIPGFGGGPFGMLFAASGRNMRGATGTGGARNPLLAGGGGMLSGAAAGAFTAGPGGSLASLRSSTGSRAALSNMQQRLLFERVGAGAFSGSMFTSAAFTGLRRDKSGRLRDSKGRFVSAKKLAGGRLPFPGGIRSHLDTSGVGARRFARGGNLGLVGAGPLAHDARFQAGRAARGSRMARVMDALFLGALLKRPGRTGVMDTLKGLGGRIRRIPGATGRGVAALGRFVKSPLQVAGRSRFGIGIARFLQGFSGGTAARVGTGATRLAGGGVIGAVVGGISLLGPVFREVGAFFARIGEQKGIIGAVANTLSIIFRTLQLIANLTNKVFGFIFTVLKKIIDFIGNIPGLKQLFGFIGGGLRGLSGGLEDANVALGDKPGKIGSGAGDTVVNVINDGDTSAEAGGMIARSVSGRGSGVI